VFLLGWGHILRIIKNILMSLDKRQKSIYLSLLHKELKSFDKSDELSNLSVRLVTLAMGKENLWCFDKRSKSLVEFESIEKPLVLQARLAEFEH